MLGTTAVAPHRLRWSRQFRRVTHSAVVVAGAVCVALIVLVAAFAGSIAPHDPDEQNFDLIEARPSAQALFGTDRFGRDVLSRVIHGTRISLYVAVTSIVVAMAAGGILGLTRAASSGSPRATWAGPGTTSSTACSTSSSASPASCSRWAWRPCAVPASTAR